MHKLLDVRADTLAMRDALSSVASIQVDGDVTASSLRTALDRASLSSLHASLTLLSPLALQVDSLARSCHDINTSLQAARERISASQTDTASFLAAAAHLNARKAALVADLNRVNRFLSQFELTREEAEALSEGPAAARATHFFQALERVGEIKSQSLALLTTGDQALGLELLDAATLHQSRALDVLFEFTLPLCKGAADLTPAGEGADEQEAQEGSIASTPHTLKRALCVLKSSRPVYFNSCGDAIAAARRSALVKSFLRALTGAAPPTAASSATSAAGVPSSSRAIDASAHDPLRYIGDMLAWTHLATAEEREMLAYLLPPHEAEQGGVPETKDAGEPAAAAVGGSTAPSPASLLTVIVDGISKPLRVRIEQMVTSQAMSSSLITLFRVLDLLAFYTARFHDMVDHDASALVAALRACFDRTLSVFRDACAATSARIRASTLALPHDLTPSSLTTGTLTLADELLKAGDKCMYAGGDAAGIVLPPVTDALTALLEPLLAACRASAEGLRLTDTATYMLNNLAALHAVLASSSPAAAPWVHRLASEMNSWEESLVQAAANDMLAACGMLAKLAAVKAASDASSSGVLASTPGVTPDELRPVINAFLASLASPAYVTLYDRVQNARVRSRVRRDTGAVLAAAYARLYDAVTSPRAGYTALCDVTAMLRQTPAQVALLADVN